MTYQEIIQSVGKQIEKKVYYYDNNNTRVNIDIDNIESVKLAFNCELIGTLMKSAELKLKENIQTNNKIFIDIVATYGEYTATKTYGPYFTYETKYNADDKTYTHTLYDYVLKTMVNYEPINITYPCTLQNYYNKLIETLGLTSSVSLINGSNTLNSDIYSDINYTYRSVLQDIAEANGTLLYVDGTEVKKIQLSNSNIATINDDILKNTNIGFGEHYGPINVVSLSRSADSDIIYYPETLPNNKHEFKIKDNQLMNDNNRVNYIQKIYNNLNGIEYDIFDTELVGYGGFTPLQKVVFETGNKTYTSYVFNNEIEITSGYKETIYTDVPVESETDYSSADTTDQRIKETYIIVDKQNQKINSVVTGIETQQKDINEIKDTTTLQKGTSNNPIIIDDAYSLQSMSIDGMSEQDGTPTPDNPSEVKTVQGIRNLAYMNSISTISGGFIMKTNSTFGNVIKNKTYTLSMTCKSGLNISKNLSIRNYYPTSSSSTYEILKDIAFSSGNRINCTFTATQDGQISINSVIGQEENDIIYDILLEQGSVVHPYVPYGNWLVEKIVGKNLYNENIFRNNYTMNTNGEPVYNAGQNRVTNITPIDVSKLDSVKVTYKNNINFIYSIFNGTTLIERVSNKKSGYEINTKNATNLYICFYDGVTIETLQEVMISSKGGEYEPYKEHTSLIDMNKYDDNGNIVGYHELCKIGDIQDTYKDGVLTKRIGKVVLNGGTNETWDWGNTGATETKLFKSLNISGYTGLCSHFTFQNNTTTWTGNNKCGFNSTYTFWCQSTEFTDLATFKTWLSNNPVTVYYVLAEPETIELKHEDLTIFDGYNEITNINQYDLKNNMSIVYLTNSKLNQTYALQSQVTQTANDLTISFNQTINNTKNELQTAIDNVEVDKVITKNEFRFDMNGLSITNDSNQANTLIDSNGLNVTKNDGSESLKAGYDETLQDMVVKTNKLVMNDRSRYENFIDENNNPSIGCFWVGE